MKSIYDDTFEHHGIKGQKWGERNGPPYPLEDNHGSSGKHEGDKKKSGSSGSSGKHRLLSLFRKRDKTQEETKDNKKAKEISDVDRREMRNVFKGVFNNSDISRVDMTIDRYLKRADYDVQLAYNLLRWDLNVLVMTGKWSEHKPKDLPSNYRNYVDTWRSVNQNRG